MKGAAVAIASFVAIVALWAWVVEPHLILEVDRETAAIPALPPSLEGSKIAVISDLQIGMWLDNPAVATRAVERILEERPAAALILGDFIYFHEGQDVGEELGEVVELLRPLGESDIPTYAVLGNHDYANPGATPTEAEITMAERLTHALEATGIEVLDNEAVPLRAASDAPPLYLVGIGSEWANNAKIDEALSSVPDGAPRLVFMHNPVTFNRLAAGEAPVAVAGHTHGGQVRVPGFPNWSWLEVRLDREVHTDGWHSGPGGNSLYVTRGIGFSKLPVRLFAPPELTLFSLRPSSPETRAAAPPASAD